MAEVLLCLCSTIHRIRLFTGRLWSAFTQSSLDSESSIPLAFPSFTTGQGIPLQPFIPVKSKQCHSLCLSRLNVNRTRLWFSDILTAGWRAVLYKSSSNYVGGSVTTKEHNSNMKIHSLSWLYSFEIHSHQLWWQEVRELEGRKCAFWFTKIKGDCSL